MARGIGLSCPEALAAAGEATGRVLKGAPPGGPAGPRPHSHVVQRHRPVVAISEALEQQLRARGVSGGGPCLASPPPQAWGLTWYLAPEPAWWCRVAQALCQQLPWVPLRDHRRVSASPSRLTARRSVPRCRGRGERARVRLLVASCLSSRALERQKKEPSPSPRITHRSGARGGGTRRRGTPGWLLGPGAG